MLYMDLARQVRLFRGIRENYAKTSQNPRHTFQSWRDRWIKYVSKRPAPQGAIANPSLPPQENISNHEEEGPTAAFEVSEDHRAEAVTPWRNLVSKPPPIGATFAKTTTPKAIDVDTWGPFTPEETQSLLDKAWDITKIDQERRDRIWAGWAREVSRASYAFLYIYLLLR